MREELTTEKIIENCKKFRGEEYDYSKVKKWENGEETKIEVVCQHGSYWTNLKEKQIAKNALKKEEENMKKKNLNQK